MSVMVPEQNNFAAGEVSPLLYGRWDFQRVKTGVRTASGFMPLPQGPITRAPGTIFRGETKSNLPARLIPFEFSENDALTIELTAGTMRVWRYGELVDGLGGPYEMGVPWTTIDEIRALDTEQSADVIYVASPNRMIHTLNRFDLNIWGHAELEVQNGPFQSMNVNQAATVTASAATGAITLTLSSPAILAPEHAGTLLRIEVENYDTIPLWSPNTAITAGDKWRYDGRIYEFVSGTDSGEAPPTHTYGTRLMDTASGAKWKYTSEAHGLVRLTAQNTSTSWSADVVKIIPEPCVTSTTYRWSLSAWSAKSGYPRYLAIYDEHLFAAVTDAAPRTFWFSVNGDYDDFLAGTEADLGGGYTIPGSVSLNEIKWLYPGSDGLLIGALGEVFRVFPPDTSASIGPTNIRRVTEAKEGVTSARPIFPFSYPVLITKGWKRLVELRRGNNGQPDPALLSLPAQHIASTGMTDIAWQAAPYGIAWIQRPQNGLSAMTYMPDQEVLGWFSVPIAGGVVSSLAVTPHPEFGRDVVTMVVSREIGGVTKYFVEELADNSDVVEGAAAAHDAVHLYAASVFAPDPATDSFSVPHLAGETVWAWTDIGSFGPFDVAPDGSVTLPGPVSHAVIGLFDDTHELETLPIRPDAPDGSALGRKTRVHAKGGIRLHRSAGGRVQSVAWQKNGDVYKGTARDLIPRPILTRGSDLYSGVQPLDVPSGVGEETTLIFTPVGGAPLTIAAIATPVEEVGP